MRVTKKFNSHLISASLQWTPQIGVTYNVSTVPAVDVQTIGNSSANLSLLYSTVYNVSIVATSPCGQTIITSIDLYYGEQRFVD